MGVILKLNNVRLSFPKLDDPDYFTPGTKSRPTEKRRWSASFHIHKTDPQKAAVDAALKKLAEEKWAAKANTNLLNILPDPKGCCWQDGARKEMPDVFILNSHRYENQGRPIVIDSDMTSIYKQIEAGGRLVATNEIALGKAGRIYSGCYVNAKVEFWAQDNPSGKGLRATLLVVQRLKDGDAFGGGAAPNAEEFGEITEGADSDDLM